MAMDWASVSIEVLAEYTTRAIFDLERRGVEALPDNIRDTRTKLYQKDIEIASIANAMKLGRKRDY